MAPPQGRKKSLGRRKIDMKLIADENARVVTFSKRRAGIFKKATELSVLCGTQIALIIFSLGGRAYSFGHPNVESVVARFLNRVPIPTPQESAQEMRIRIAMLQKTKQQLDEKSEELETKKEREKEIEAELESSEYHISSETLDGLDLNQLHQLKEKMEKLREIMRRLADEPNSTSDAGPSSSGAMNLAKVGKKEGAASPIPSDWLKL